MACSSAVLGLYFAISESYLGILADGRVPDELCTLGAGAPQLGFGKGGGGQRSGAGRDRGPLVRRGGVVHGNSSRTSWEVGRQRTCMLLVVWSCLDVVPGAPTRRPGMMSTVQTSAERSHSVCLLLLLCCRFRLGWPVQVTPRA